jgi:ferric-dicitrate binding protein FerR (iron transport regulator)
MSEEQTPKRWVDHPEPKNPTARALKQLLLDVEAPAVPAAARARVADRLATEPKDRSRGYLFAAAAVAAALFIFFLREPAPVETPAENALVAKETTLVLPQVGEARLFGDTKLTLSRFQHEMIAEMSPGTASFTLTPMQPPNTFSVRAGRFTVRAGSGSFEVFFENGVAKLTVSSGDARIEYRESEEELYAKAREERDPERAIALYDRVAAMNGSHAEIAAHQAARRTMKLGKPAIARFEALLQRFPNGTFAHEARLDLLECRIKGNDLSGARREIDLFLSEHPESERSAELLRMRDRLK